MRKRHILLLLTAVVIAVPCHGARSLQTPRTRGLIRELLVKLDSTDVYAANKERGIEAAKARLQGLPDVEYYGLCYDIAKSYSKYKLDSSLVYIDKAIETARNAGRDSLMLAAEFTKASILYSAGFTTEALETLHTISRSKMKGGLLVSYYNAWAELYHSIYNGSHEPAVFRKKYRASYNEYRDSLLSVLDTANVMYLRNMERKEARAGNYAEARRYNSIRLSVIGDTKSPDYATCLYDRFMISYFYERKLTGEAIDDLFESAIIEVGDCNYDIASLLRVEAYLIDVNEVSAAKKVSDYYYASLRTLGSRQRIIDGGEQAIRINDRNSRLLQKKNSDFKTALVFISLLLLALLLTLFVINNSRLKITRLKDNLERSGRISKGYVGVVFQLYSSYIRRLDVFRTKIHSTLKKGRLEQALELTSPSGDIALEERRELFRNFDSAFVDIFPDFIGTVNSCLKPEDRIEPKKTEILNNELRMLALIKLGIKDSTEIADLLHCSVKTVYNLRSMLKARLAIPEEDFDKVISEL